MPVSNSSAVWKGNLVDGNGSMKLGKGGYEGPFTKASRFENGAGTNPEELIAAAHAGCYIMALSFQLTGAGFPPAELRCSAQIDMDNQTGGWTFQKITLRLEGEVPGISEEKFQELAQAAKAGCPVSKALASVPIELEAQLKG